MKKSGLIITLTIAIALVLFHIDEAHGCNYPPTAVIRTIPSGTVFYNGTSVVLDGSHSTTNGGGNIIEYWWQTRPVGTSGWTDISKGQSPATIYTFPLLANDHNQRDYQLRLTVKNISGLSHARTITVTVRRSHDSFYYLTDHLGSVRVTVDDKGNSVGRDDYYPFGLRMPGRSQCIGSAENGVYEHVI